MRRISESGLYIFLVALMIGYYGSRGEEGGSARRPPVKSPVTVETPPPSTDRPSASPRTGLPEFSVRDSAKSQDASGSAVSVDGSGLYMTARHVIDGCRAVYIEADPSPSGMRRWMQAERVIEHPFADLALIDLGGNVSANVGSATTLAPRPSQRDEAIFVGYPQGSPGTVTARALGEVNVRFSGSSAQFRPRMRSWRQRPRFSDRTGKRAERGYAWVETGRYPDIEGSLGGLSGGPAFSPDGRLVGIVIAEARRRGRVVTSQPDNMATLTEFPGDPVEAFRTSDFVAQADRLRANRVSAFVYCDVG